MIHCIGETRATSRRLSDTSNSVWQFREEDSREVPDHGIEDNKTLIQSAQETVAKALGGGSRGELLVMASISYPSLMK